MLKRAITLLVFSAACSVAQADGDGADRAPMNYNHIEVGAGVSEGVISSGGSISDTGKVFDVRGSYQLRDRAFVDANLNVTRYEFDVDGFTADFDLDKVNVGVGLFSAIGPADAIHALIRLGFERLELNDEDTDGATLTAGLRGQVGKCSEVAASLSYVLLDELDGIRAEATALRSIRDDLSLFGNLRWERLEDDAGFSLRETALTVGLRVHY